MDEDKSGPLALKELWNADPSHRASIREAEATTKWKKLTPDERKKLLREYYVQFGRYPR